MDTSNITTLTLRHIRSIVEEAKQSPLRRARILLHHDHSSPSQKMLIAIFHDSVVGLHRHPTHKTETYIPLIGDLEVNYVESEVSHTMLVKPISLDELSAPSVVTHHGGIWHQPKSLSEYCVYLEIYDGPFEKDKDVQYYS